MERAYESSKTSVGYREELDKKGSRIAMREYWINGRIVGFFSFFLNERNLSPQKVYGEGIVERKRI